MTSRRLPLAAAALAAFAAAPAAAQNVQDALSAIQIEPYVGAFTDAYDISPDGENAGVMAGVRAAYPVATRLRAVANLGYARTRNVSDPTELAEYWLYDNVWAITTAGGEVDVIQGATTLSVGGQIGAAWRRNELTGQVGNPDPATDAYSHGGYAAIDLVAPELTLRHRVTPRASLRLTVQDQITDFLEGPVKHSPAIWLGVSLH